MTDAELIDRCAKGEEAAFLILYEQYSGRLYRFAYRLLDSRQLAEDVVQDCFVSLMRNFRRYDPERGALCTYLFAIVRHLAQKHFRQTGDEVVLEYVPDQPDSSESFDPLLRLLVQERSTRVRNAIAVLSPLLREVLVLFEYEDLSIAEIAGIVGSDPGTVKVRLHRARQNLRKLLSSTMSHQMPAISREEP